MSMISEFGEPEDGSRHPLIKVRMSPKLIAYLDELVKVEGYGEDREEVMRNFVWAEINRLISVGRLKAKFARKRFLG
jgi:hypothetical protein